MTPLPPAEAVPGWRVALERLAILALGIALDVLSLPPGPAPALAFVADAPFLWLLWHRGGRRWWLWAFLFGFARIAIGLRWLGAIHSLFPLGPGAAHAPVYVLWGLAIRWGVRRGVPYLLLVPVTAVLEEMLRTVFLGGMPWPCRPLALTAWQPLVGFASVFGAYGLTFLAALGGAWASGLPSVLRGAEARRAALGPLLARGLLVAATVVVAALRGGLRVAAFDDRAVAGETVVTAPVVLVQANIPQALKHSPDDDAPRRIFDAHLRLTADALRAEPHAGLVVWPETMIPWPFLSPGLAARYPEMWESEHNVLRHLQGVAQDAPGVRYMVGASYYLEGRTGPHAELLDHDTMDSVFFVDPRRVPETAPTPHPEIPAWRPPWEIPPGRHDKVVLVPGGEYTPLGDLIPPLRAFKEYLSPIPELTPGSRDVGPFVLEVHPPANRRRGDVANREVAAGTANCFEIAFPAFCRSWRARGATVLVNAANYGWFGDSGMPAQILAIGRLRAAELNVSVAMAGNTGPTAIVDPVGRVRTRVESGGKGQFVEGWCAGPLWSDSHETLYAAWGDVPWFAAAGALLLVALLRRRARPAPAAVPADAAAAAAEPPAGPPPGPESPGPS